MSKIKKNIFVSFLKKMSAKKEEQFTINYVITGNVIQFTGSAALTGENLKQFGISSGSIKMKPEEHECICNHYDDYDNKNLGGPMSKYGE